ncbi:14539_t:CDS:2 [Gigaspora margarita]|uniref:14539_t:CDS:1 n=1 Tax=Gigaspora margarita TaxID=4874 RepID=A0ABN7UEH4_GIGMA|nr:14539_t:CDS:2 [Gigaspora margarita]
MPKRNKYSLHCSKAARKWWKKYDDSEIDSKISDNESDNAENEPIHNEFLEALQDLRPEVFEKLIEGAKKLNVWKKGQKPAYTADNNQLPQNKQELLFDEDTEHFVRRELSPNEYEELSSYEDDEFSSNKNNDDLSFNTNNDEIIDINICNGLYNELPLRTVSQFLYLVKDHGYTKMLASELLARSVNKGPWHARVIRTWANQWLSKGEISTLLRGCHVKTKSLLSHEDFKSNIRQYLRANKFKITPKQFVKLVEYEAIPALGSSIHISEFICEIICQICLSQEEKEANGSLPDNIVKQVSERAIPIFERMHSEKVALFMFDNSCNHNAFAEDALLVSRMNMKDRKKKTASS